LLRCGDQQLRGGGLAGGGVAFAVVLERGADGVRVLRAVERQAQQQGDGRHPDGRVVAVDRRDDRGPGARADRFELLDGFGAGGGFRRV
jgi:hypothetical protein